MPIMGQTSPEHDSAANDRILLRYFIKRENTGETPHQAYFRSFRYLLRVFEDAKDPESITHRREFFVKCLGEEKAERIIALFHAFFEGYLKSCMDHGAMQPLAFVPTEDRDEAMSLLGELLEAMNSPGTYGFPLWPPPRRNTHLCCGG